MELKSSETLVKKRPVLEKLLKRLLAKYEYASILAQDSKTKEFNIKNSGASVEQTAQDYGYDIKVMDEMVLIEEGELKAIHGIKRMSQYLGVEPRGRYNGMRVRPGTATIAELKKEPYIEVVKFSSFDFEPMDGYFGGEIRLGYVYDGNEIHIVTGGSVSGNMFEAQKNMRFSSETYKDINYEGPKAIRFEGVSVAGQ